MIKKLKILKYANNLVTNIWNIIKNDKGEGSYATVKLIEEIETNKLYAMKVYEKNKISDSIRRKNVRREIEILHLLNHPNIIKINHVIDTPL